MSGSEDYDSLPARLGNLKIGKSCLYSDKLADVDLPTLRLLVRTSAADMAPACPVS